MKSHDEFYTEGCRDGLAEAITTLLDLVNKDNQEYVFSQIEKRIMFIRSRAEEARWKARGW